MSRGSGHASSKPNRESIRLLDGLGVEGDAHLDETVKHRSRVAAASDQPNLRQVHLIHAELHDGLRAPGLSVPAGQMGENVTTRGMNLLGLPTGTRRYLGDEAVVEVTGLRNACAQLDDFRPGLMAALLDRNEHGDLFRKAGIYGPEMPSASSSYHRHTDPSSGFKTIAGAKPRSGPRRDEVP